MGYWSEFDLRSALQNKSSPSLCPERSCRLKKRRAHLATAAEERDENGGRKKGAERGKKLLKKDCQQPYIRVLKKLPLLR